VNDRLSATKDAWHMRRVNEYKDHAKACRELAARAILPSDKKVLEELAQAWERIARLRESDIADHSNE
jgi:Skp family chaperone for outer membrane proteins